MDEEILKQQKILAETLRMAIQRLEEASKFYQEKAAELSRTNDTALVLIEALKKSLDESDTQIDDLAGITRRQMEMYQQMQQGASSGA